MMSRELTSGFVFVHVGFSMWSYCIFVTNLVRKYLLPVRRYQHVTKFKMVPSAIFVLFGRVVGPPTNADSWSLAYPKQNFLHARLSSLKVIGRLFEFFVL